MNIKQYLWDKKGYIFSSIILILWLELYLIIFEQSQFLLVVTPAIIVTLSLLPLLREFYKKRTFYNDLLKSVERLDKKYLFTELISEPDFLEGRIVYNVAIEVNHNIADEISRYRTEIKEYKEYIDLWVHEVKTPIATAKLMNENTHNESMRSLEEELDKIEMYVEQTLYYSKIGTLEQDYRIAAYNLKELVFQTIKKNKKMLIGNRVHMNVEILEETVFTDAKWLEFILNQIIGNSIKYMEKKEKELTIRTIKQEDNIILTVTDNGIGIKKEELSKVLLKGFVGTNGRKKEASTGMGLYLCKRMLDKMHHSIWIESEEQQFTTVFLSFPKNSFYLGK